MVFGHQVRQVSTVHLLANSPSSHRITRIRGVSYAIGVSGSQNARMIDAARGWLNKLSPDTRIFSDNVAAGFVQVPVSDPPSTTHRKLTSTTKQKLGIGFGLSLVAETHSGILYAADEVSPPQGGLAAEDVGQRAALRLFERIEQGGAVERLAAPMVLILMSLGPEDVGRVQLGRHVLGSEEVVQLARDTREFGLRAWGLRDANVDHDGESDGGDVVVSVVGRGIGNVGRKVA